MLWSFTHVKVFDTNTILHSVIISKLAATRMLCKTFVLVKLDCLITLARFHFLKNYNNFFLSFPLSLIQIHIQRTEGCDHMTCSQCNTNFCYRCGERYRQLRFFGDHTSNLSIFGCKYRYLPERPHLRRLVRGSVCGEYPTRFIGMFSGK